MSTAIRAGTANDGYWQVNGTDIVKVTASLTETLTSLRVNSATSSTAISINASAGVTNAALVYAKAGSPRWSVNMDNQSEAGSNAGSDFAVYAYSDAGSTLAIPMQIARATGKTTFNQSVTVSSNVGGGAVVNVNTTGTNGAAYAWLKGGIARWSLNIGNVETGSNVGSDLVMYRFDDAGASIGTALSIARSSGATTISGSLLVQNNNFTLAGQTAGSVPIVSLQIPSPGATDGQIAQIHFRDLSNTTGGENRLAGIVAYREVVGDTTAGGRLEFWTRTNGVSTPWTSRMQIGNSGTVAIPGQLATKYVRETMMSVTNVTGTYNVDIPNNGSIQNYVLTGNTTLTFPTGVGWSGVSFTLLVKQGTSSYTLTWPTTVRWPNASPGTNSQAVSIPTTVNMSHIYTFLYDGAVWLGSVGGQNYTR